MNLPNYLHPDDAKRDGFTIDSHCYPWAAYKGERFRPTEIHSCFTELESLLIRQRPETILG